jgi:extracellular factor (EF) 3-hydroxypalmitic acid methyl ester biosynthesis protein
MEAYFPLIFNFGIDLIPVSREQEEVVPPPPVFLTRQDWDLLFEKATVAKYRKGDLILEKGAQQRTIYVLKKGTVSVETAPGVEVGRRGEGAVFGEMSFLDNRGASASIVAQDSVDVYLLPEAQVNALLISVPGLATRFYQTLAVTLAYRLREASDMLSKR